MPAEAEGAASFDFEAVFRAEYVRVSKVIARVVRDPARAEELAAEVFWKLSRTPKAQGPNAGGWLYRTATRMGLDELRKRLRREKYEALFDWIPIMRTPEEIHFENEDQRCVRAILSRMKENQAQLLILRSEGFIYEEIAGALHLNAASIGTLLRRAEEVFRTEYVRRYGKHR
jgi:RNA polymerase sigma-70 factor (ECF subfamily)